MIDEASPSGLAFDSVVDHHRKQQQRPDPIDITEPALEMCRRLGLDPLFVRELRIWSRAVQATLYVKNEQGAKFLGNDGNPVTETMVFDVRT